MFIEVAVPANINMVYTYRIDLTKHQDVEVGGIVFVNFSNREVHAVVTAINVQPSFDINKIKEIIAVVNPCYFGKELFKVLIQASDYFVTSLGTSLYTALPPLYRNNSEKQNSYSFILQQYKLDITAKEVLRNFWQLSEHNIREIFDYNYWLATILETDYYSSLLQNQNFALTLASYLQEEQEKIFNNPDFKSLKKELAKQEINLLALKCLLNVQQYIVIFNYYFDKLNLQKILIDKQNGEIVLDTNLYEKIEEISKNDLPKINQNTQAFNQLNNLALIQNGNILINCQSFQFIPYTHRSNTWFTPLQKLSYSERQKTLINVHNKLQLNEQQENALQQIINSNGYNAYLLDGVTGSGKTEVYLQLIEHYILQGKSCLVLVPEIGLTPQTVARFANRFKVKIQILHSNVNDAIKNQVIHQAQQGEVAVLIGTRSAIFTQLQDLGCIIIDEEHDSSYKQQSDFRYNARDIAILRAYNLNIPIVMGSATPSFSSLANLENGKFKHLILSKRAQAKIDNRFVLIDIRKQNFLGIEDKRVLLNKAGITGDLWLMMQEELQKNNQVLLFLNRRGFATELQCISCNYVFICPECDRPLTYHRRYHELRCHHCGIHLGKPPEHCPNCHANSLQPLGAGTEQIERLCSQAYSADKIIRIDRDTSRTAQHLEHNLHLAHHTEGAIMIGTQMISKGHHFPNVTLVALLNIDGMVMNEDYRAAERLAQLYIQVAGRAGRAEKPGTVVLQTALPFEKIYQDLLTLSYFKFAEVYLQQRKFLNLPPYTYQAYLAVRHLDPLVVQEHSEFICHLINETINTMRLDGYNINYKLSTYDLGKQNKLTKFIIDFIVDQRQVRSIILERVNQLYQDSALFKKQRPIFYIDVDPYDLN